MNPVTVTLTSPATGFSQDKTMYRPLKNPDGSVADALILGRYTGHQLEPIRVMLGQFQMTER
jgi:hypothetical protein